MKTVRGRFQDGVALPEEPVLDREGERVLITFLGDLDMDENEESDELAAVVAAIQALGANPANIIYPTRSLAELLAESSHDAPIDAEVWNRQWAEIEAEMKARDLQNNEEEGRA
jgi:hypothetical protein